MFYCPNCGQEIIKSYPDGKHKCRTNIIIWENDKVFCKCTKCHSEVPIPVILKLPTGKSVPPDGGVKFFVIEGMKNEEVKKSEKGKTVVKTRKAKVS